MARITLNTDDFADLERALREIPGKVEAALERAMANLQRDALEEWRRLTPERTGALRRSLRVAVTRGAGGQRGGWFLQFDTEPPGDEYYARVNRRHRMTPRLFAWLRRNVRLYVRRELNRAFR